MEEKKPNCYKCVHLRTVAGSCHRKCNNPKAKVTGHPLGLKRGWFMHPYNFDPTWLISCDGFSDNKDDNLPDRKTDPLLEVMSILHKT